MSRASHQSPWRTLRRLALSGKRDEAEAFLLRMLKDNPDDREVRAELTRLRTGQSLLCTESKKERKKRVSQEVREAIDEAIRRYGEPHILSCSSSDDLHALRKQLKNQLSLLKENKTPAPQGTADFCQMLERELSRRRKKGSRVLFRWLGGCFFVLLAAGGALWLLHRRALSLCDQLEASLRANEWKKTEQLLQATDTGINRLLAKKVEVLTGMVKRWQQSVPRRAAEFAQKISLYKKHHAVSSISMEERSELLREIRALPEPFSKKLLADWDELCRPEREVLERQKQETVARLTLPYPQPKLSGNLDEDLPVLRTADKELSALLKDFCNAQTLFDLDSSIIASNKDIADSVAQCLSDAEQLKRAQVLLGTARTYGEHLHSLKGFKPALYAPARQAYTSSRELPATEEEMQAMLRSMRHNIPRHLPDHVLKAILHRGPSFGQHAPASVEHLHIMEELFTSASLRQVLYEIVALDGRVIYSNEAPKLTEKGGAHLVRSDIDPQYKPGENAQIFLPIAAGMRVRCIDPRPLLKAVRLERATFFLTANLPDLLGRLTCIQDENCPALAKAYTFNTLLKIIHTHPKQKVLGLRFAPTMERDIRSFLELEKSLNYPLTPNCWLSRSTAATAAELAFNEWFRDHARRDYSAEMKRNFEIVLKGRSHYIGFIDINSKPNFKAFYSPKSDTLRYFSKGQLVASPAGEPLQSPDPFSPIFRD